MRAIKSSDTIFLCLHVFKFHKFLSQNKRPNFLSQWEQSKFWHHTFCVFMSLLSFDFSWSFSKKNRGNHWLHFDAKAVCDTAYSSQIDLFLDFWWSCSKQLEEDFSWIFSKKLNEICNVLSCMSHCVLLFFIFSWLFMKLQQKKQEKTFNGISMPRLWYKVLLSNWLFLTFHEASAKNLKKYLFAF